MSYTDYGKLANKARRLKQAEKEAQETALGDTIEASDGALVKIDPRDLNTKRLQKVHDKLLVALEAAADSDSASLSSLGSALAAVSSALERERNKSQLGEMVPLLLYHQTLHQANEIREEELKATVFAHFCEKYGDLIMHLLVKKMIDDPERIEILLMRQVE